MNKKIFPFLVAIIVICIILSICFAFQIHSSNSRIKLNNELISAKVQYQNGALPYIDISTLTKFQWDRLYIFGPYAQCNLINKKLDIVFWPECKFTGIEGYDDISILIFTKQRHVIQYLVVNRSQIDFSTVTSNTGYSPSNSLFKIDIYGNCTWEGQK
jgi:hypothetical protein